jgi:ABC-2 type transport system permease protein
MFYISTILVLAFIVLMTNFDSITEAFSEDNTGNVAVIDESGQLLAPLHASIESSGNEDLKLKPFSGSIDEGKEAVIQEKYVALVTLGLGEDGKLSATYYANTISETNLQTTIQQQLQQLKLRLATESLGVDQSQVMEIFTPVSMKTVALDVNSKTEEELNQARGIVYVMLMLLYFAVLMYGTLIATDVATEKSSRVMEVLVSSVSPVIHMFAKIVGIALLGLTQVAIFIVVGFIMLQSKQDEIGGMMESLGLQNISVSILLYGILFFILGYFLYATLAAMLGSLVSRVEEVNQMIIPMTFLIVIAFLLAMFGMGAPEATIIKVTSYIPFFSPMLMFIRVGLLDTAIWEVLLSVGILIVTIIVFAVIGARVYKGGVLLYGKSSSLKDIKKALQLTKRE